MRKVPFDGGLSGSDTWRTIPANQMHDVRELLSRRTSFLHGTDRISGAGHARYRRTPDVITTRGGQYRPPQKGGFYG